MKYWISLIMLAIASGQTVPRPAADLELTEAGGSHVSLAGYRGNAVVVAFMVATCKHCQAVSQELERMYVDYGQRGLRVIGAIFDGDAPQFALRFHLVYPVASVPRSTMERFMGVPQGTRVGTPQLAFIDRRGMIRAQSQREGSPMLQQPEVIRGIIEMLIKGAR